MTFNDWIFSNWSKNPEINGQWGFRHIFVIILCIAIIVALSLIFYKKSEKSRRIVIYTLISIILTFELTRRILNLINTTDYSLNHILYTLLPRPWCAISCWTLIFAMILKKQVLFNFGSISSLLCALIFFAYPEAGFNNQYIMFENLYSISTHSLLLITSITLITFRITNFDYKTIWKELIFLACVFAYAFFEIHVLDIASDPLYFMPGNDVQNVLGFDYKLFLPVYIVFIAIYFNLFYFITYLVKKRKNNKKTTKV